METKSADKQQEKEEETKAGANKEPILEQLEKIENCNEKQEGITEDDKKGIKRKDREEEGEEGEKKSEEAVVTKKAKGAEQDLTKYKPAANLFDPDSLNWKNKGPALKFNELFTTVTADPHASEKTNWRQIRSDSVLTPKPNQPESNLYEFSLHMDSLRHAEVVLGVVDPDTAPKTPYCLHSCKPKDGVYIKYFSFKQVAEGDVITVLIDLNASVILFARNGKIIPDSSINIPTTIRGVVPVFELYGHDYPTVSLTTLK